MFFNFIVVFFLRKFILKKNKINQSTEKQDIFIPSKQNILIDQIVFLP